MPVDEIGPEQIGPAVERGHWPPWAQQFSGFLRVYRLVDEPGYLVRCRACDLALIVPPRFNPTVNWRTIMQLATHGMEHAAAGELPWLKDDTRARSPSPEEP